MGGTFFVLNNGPYPGKNACDDTMAFRVEFHKCSVFNDYYVYILIFYQNIEHLLKFY